MAEVKENARALLAHVVEQEDAKEELKRENEKLRGENGKMRGGDRPASK